MLRRAMIVGFAVAGMALAEPHWIRARYGAFEAIGDDGRQPAVRALSQFARFSFALGTVLGQPDLKLDPPVRIVIFKSQKDLAEHCPGEALREGRDRLMACAVAEGQLPQPLLRALTKKLIEANAPSVPESVETGLESFFSTIQSNNVHVTWGAPPPAAERTRDWALLHMVITQPEYLGKAQVFLHNLAAGMERSAAARNAFGDEAAKFEASVDRYLAAGSFSSAQAPNRTLNTDRDVTSTALTSDEGELVRADLMTPESKAGYEAVLKAGRHTTEANEGLGLIALREHDTAAAVRYMEAARQGGTKNYIALTGYAALVKDEEKAVAILRDALTIEPKYAMAHWVYGEKLSDPRRRAGEWKQACDLAPRNYEWWEKYARLSMERTDYAEAGRAWTAASLAAPDAATRDRYLNERAKIEQLRIQAADEARRRDAEEKARELERLKNEARAHVAELEARASRQAAAGAKPGSKDAPVVDWFDTGADGKITGTLQRVECLGKSARLVVKDDAGQTQTLLVRDPSQLVVQGGGDSALSCGPQRQARKVTVAYRKSAVQGVAGEAIGLEYN